MKSILLLLLLFTGVMFSSCQKDVFTDKPEQNQIETEWKYTKDITLKNGANAAFLRICSNYEDSLYSYLEGVDITLNVFSKDKPDRKLIETGLVDNKEIDKSRYEVQEPSVIIEHFGSNLDQETTSYSITFSPKLLKSISPLPIAAHETYNRFMGLVTEDDGGMDLYVGYFFKLSRFVTWTQVELPTMMSRPGYGSYPCPFDTYKMRIQVYMDIEDDIYPTYSFYQVVQYYQRRGTNCQMGTYVEPNCYIGTAPTGTIAFVYNNKFYYTPLNGNQCPLTGSNFDGTNCFVASVPLGAFPSVWNNKWFIEPYLEYDLIGFHE